MKAEIIAIGTELLMGYVVNTNASDIAKALLGIGVGTYYQQIVGDNPQRLTEALSLAAERSDIVVLSGGLGPTHDDITKQLVAAFVQTRLVEDSKQKEKLVRFFQEERREMAEIDLRQVLTLEGGESLFNQYGLACGCLYEAQGTLFVLLPGPPYEMNQMLKKEALPRIMAYANTTQVVQSVYLNFQGIGESKLAMTLADLIDNQVNPTIGIYAKPRHVVIRLTANAKTVESANQLNQQLADQILERLLPYYIGSGEEVDFYHYIMSQAHIQGVTFALWEGFTDGLLTWHLRQANVQTQVVDKTVVATVLPETLRTHLAQLQQQTQVDYVLGNTIISDNHALVGCYHRDGDYTQRNVTLSQRPRHIQQEVIGQACLHLLREQIEK